MPRPLTGNGRGKVWLQRLADETKRNTLLSGNGYRVKQYSSGKILEFTNKAPTIEFHPFEIYRFPSDLRAFKNADDGQRFKIRGGQVQLGPGSSRQTVYGTDYCGFGPRDQLGELTGPYGISTALAVQVPPTTSAAIVPGLAGFGYGGWNEIVVGTGNANQVDIWISFVADDGSNSPPSSTVVAICYGLTSATGTGATNLATGNTFNDLWPGYPNDDQYHRYVGTIWILDSSETSVMGGNAGDAIITQGLYHDVVTSGFPYGNGDTTWSQPLEKRWIGTFNNSWYYWPGDCVKIQTGTTPGDTLDEWIYDPDSGSAYYGATLKTQMSGVDPTAGGSPDPWKLISHYTYT